MMEHVFLNYGCIDSLAYNYVPIANTDDGSCIYKVHNSIIAFVELNASQYGVNLFIL